MDKAETPQNAEAAVVAAGRVDLPSGVSRFLEWNKGRHSDPDCASVKGRHG